MRGPGQTPVARDVHLPAILTESLEIPLCSHLDWWPLRLKAKVKQKDGDQSLDAGRKGRRAWGCQPHALPGRLSLVSTAGAQGRAQVIDAIALRFLERELRFPFCGESVLFEMNEAAQGPPPTGHIFDGPFAPGR